jgi:type IV pilus assembly protein PilE
MIGKKGFSLMELLVTLVIIAILAGIAVPMYSGFVIRSRSSDGAAALSLIKAKQELYRSTHLTYSASLAALPGYDADLVDYGEYYQLTIDAAGVNTFRALASDTKQPIGNEPAGTDVWEITESLDEPNHVSRGY